MIHKLPADEVKLNENIIKPIEAYSNHNLTIQDTVIKYSQEAFIRKTPSYIGIGYYSNQLINLLSEKYNISKSEVIRIILTDTCHNIENHNISFSDIYNTWSYLSSLEYKKNHIKRLSYGSRN